MMLKGASCESGFRKYVAAAHQRGCILLQGNQRLVAGMRLGWLGSRFTGGYFFALWRQLQREA